MHSTRIDFDLTIPGLPDSLRDYNAKRIEKEHVETERGVVLLPVDHLFYFFFVSFFRQSTIRYTKKTSYSLSSFGVLLNFVELELRSSRLSIICFIIFIAFQ